MLIDINLLYEHEYFRSWAYNCHKFPQYPFCSITVFIFLAEFANPKSLIIRTQSVAVPRVWSRPARRVLTVPESNIYFLTLKTALVRSGAPDF